MRCVGVCVHSESKSKTGTMIWVFVLLALVTLCIVRVYDRYTHTLPSPSLPSAPLADAPSALCVCFMPVVPSVCALCCAAGVGLALATRCCSGCGCSARAGVGLGGGSKRPCYTPHSSPHHGHKTTTRERSTSYRPNNTPTPQARRRRGVL